MSNESKQSQNCVPPDYKLLFIDKGHDASRKLNVQSQQ